MMNKMLAKKITASVVLGAALSVLTTGVATAHTVTNEGYVIDTQGNLVRDGFGDCIKTGSWTPAMANASCDASLVKKPAPAPAPVVAAPAPAPAPVVAAPAPVVVAPVVVAPPPPPAPVFKTVVTEKALTLSGTSFDTGSAKLKKAATAKLAEAVTFANENKDSDLVISGYTDSRGNEAKNVKLSAARAAAVKAYLVKKGVDAKRLSSKGMGSANPVGDNKTKAGQEANRRVEIHTSVKQETKVRVN
ncbi:MAG: OmpA family protein [Gallionella sp.]|nr:OmpA family protein [Gallionella sp.]